MAKRDRKISQDKMLFGIGLGLLAAALAIIVLAFMFLINNVLPAINPDDGLTGNGEIHFDIDGFEKLGL